MFILVNIDIQNGLASVFDTSDNTTESINLPVLANQILKGRLKVYGLQNLNKVSANTQPIPSLGIGINIIESKQAFARFYVQRGYTKQQAYQMVGLSC